MSKNDMIGLFALYINPKNYSQMMILILVVFTCFFAIAQPNEFEGYVDQQQRVYIESFYGKSFHVDESYPLRVNIEEYAYINESMPFSFSKNPKYFKDKLWLAIVHTLPSKIDHIQNTRNTWCQEKYQTKYGFKCIYVLVESTVKSSNTLDTLLQLNNTYHDIYFIQMPDLKEHWFTLQQKNINAYIMALDLFPDYHFYCRVDDQIFVTVDLLSQFLMEHLKNPTVIGEMVKHRPNRNPRNKYYDPLAILIPRYFPFPAGYLSIFSKDITQFIAQWKNYYNFAPSSLEDPGFGHWMYKFTNETHKKIDLLTPKNWGGNTKNLYGDYIMFHDQRARLNQFLFMEKRIEDGYMKV